MPNVAFVRPDLAKLLPIYYLIRDVVSGETTIKAGRTKYLPMPNAEDKSDGNKARYEAYIQRAVFYNVTRRTLLGLVGQVFKKDPEIKVPALLNPVLANATGEGVNLVQLSKKATQLTLAYSRCGIFVDYPAIAEGENASVADLEKGKVRPTLYVYSPMEIINWRTTDRGAEEILSLVVIFETYCVEDDGFEMKEAGQFRVLRIDEQGYFVHEIWKEPTPTKTDGSKVPKSGNYQRKEVYFPKDASGRRLTEIPFMFIGSENNDSNPDNPNFYDLASLNVAHYRNSADYEESCFIVGQPTPVATGLTEEWAKNVLNGTLNFGSRGGIMLPSGASADLLQADENGMVKEAMEMKERQMVALGAKLVEQKQVQRTATEAALEESTESSTLSSVVKNVSDAFEWALKWAARFVGQPETSVKFALNSEFDVAKMTTEERRQFVEEWQKGAITFTEMRDGLRKAGSATESDDKAKADIQKDQVAAMALEMPENEPGDPKDKPTDKET